MAATFANVLDQALDIAGSLAQSSSYSLADEAAGLGHPISGQTGAGASITTVNSGLVTITGLTGMTIASVQNFMTISGAATGSNNGTFRIAQYLSASSVRLANANAVASDSNSGAISWTERTAYSLEDDLNYVRTDRAAIKGVAFSAAIPTYQRPSAVGTPVPASLANIAGKTTDAKTLVVNRKFSAVTVSSGNTFVTVTDTGNLKHADAVDRTGIPIVDGADSSNTEATYVEIVSAATEVSLESIADPTKRIIGRTKAGAATSPNSVQVEFRQVTKGAALSTSTAYTWESGQPTSIDMYYGYRERLDNMNESALRTVMVNGLVGDADAAKDLSDVRQVIGTADNATSMSGLLTNLGSSYVFSNLPDGTPSVVEAFNTINAQIGARTFTGAVLSSGQTISASLQSLANAVASSSTIRIIERVSSDIPAGTSHTLPNAATYTPDGTGNGQNMQVFVRGLLMDPGDLTSGNDYGETSSTAVTFYMKVRAGDHINYLIHQ